MRVVKRGNLGDKKVKVGEYGGRGSISPCIEFHQVKMHSFANMCVPFFTLLHPVHQFIFSLFGHLSSRIHIPCPIYLETIPGAPLDGEILLSRAPPFSPRHSS